MKSQGWLRQKVVTPCAARCRLAGLPPQSPNAINRKVCWVALCDVTRAVLGGFCGVLGGVAAVVEGAVVEDAGGLMLGLDSGGEAGIGVDDALQAASRKASEATSKH